MRLRLRVGRVHGCPLSKALDEENLQWNPPPQVIRAFGAHDPIRRSRSGRWHYTLVGRTGKF
jgi:hypothetical protein